jgi:hypothetical protein
MPQQHGMIERFFRSLKEECTWRRNFSGFDDARTEIARGMRWYNVTVTGSTSCGSPLRRVIHQQPYEARASEMLGPSGYARAAFQLRGVSSPMRKSLWAPARGITSVRYTSGSMSRRLHRPISSTHLLT